MAVRPSIAIFTRRGLPAPIVFGSVARGDDDDASYLDLAVEFGDDHDIVDLLALERRLLDLVAKLGLDGE